jgi:hypothetical protein
MVILFVKVDFKKFFGCYKIFSKIIKKPHDATEFFLFFFVVAGVSIRGILVMTLRGV